MNAQNRLNRFVIWQLAVKVTWSESSLESELLSSATQSVKRKSHVAGCPTTKNWRTVFSSVTAYPLESIKQRLASLLREDAIHHKLQYVTQQSAAKEQLSNPTFFTVLRNVWKNVMRIRCAGGLMFKVIPEYAS